MLIEVQEFAKEFKTLKYAVIDRGDSLSKQLAKTFKELAESKGLQHDQHEPDIVISIGGDGTLLKAFHQYIAQIDSVAFVGVHTGHLGFYADWKANELELLIEKMSTIEPTIVRYPLANIELATKSGNYNYYALNEFTLKGVDNTMVAQVNINGEQFEMFRGDGIVISTPTGSTAYNKSLGGTIVHPAIESLQVTEIASINNIVYRTLGSSVLLPKHHYCDIICMKQQRIQIHVDHLGKMFDDVVSIKCTVASKKVSFARFRPFPFWDRVRNAFIGIDSLK